MPMKTVAFICQKGGTAKTTSAINLAVEALAYGLKVVLIDLDPQVSASNWFDLRESPEPAVIAPQVPHLKRVLAQVAANGADLAIIDTAGHSNEAALEAAKAADLVFMALQPSLVDLGTVKATLDIIRMGGNPPTLAILTRVKPTGTSHEAAAEWLKQFNLEISPVTIGERIIYQHAYAQGLGVSEAEPKGKAAQEIQQLYMLTCQHVDLPTRREVAA
jgi:chromosome partitioning protein